MRALAFILMVMLLGCALPTDEQGVATKSIGVGPTSTAQGSDHIRSKCPNLGELAIEHADVFSDREIKYLQKNSTMNFRYFAYSDSINKTTHIIAISGEAEQAMQINDINCVDVLHTSGTKKGLPTGEMGLQVPNIKPPYNQLNFGHDTGVVLIEASVAKRGDNLLMVSAYDGEQPLPSGHRATTDIFIDLNQKDSVRHVEVTAAGPGEKASARVVRSDFDHPLRH
ncbi:MAG: hypothetical protein OYH77_00590 [Pseudomonadota bacterium]|nr:hypothetical protein [Pseudomonadota bacterium]